MFIVFKYTEDDKVFHTILEDDDAVEALLKGHSYKNNPYDIYALPGRPESIDPSDYIPSWYDNM